MAAHGVNGIANYLDGAASSPFRLSMNLCRHADECLGERTHLRLRSNLRLRHALARFNDLAVVEVELHLRFRSARACDDPAAAGELECQHVALRHRQRRDRAAGLAGPRAVVADGLDLMLS